MRPLHVAFLWHMHQPLYKDALSGRYSLPWVRLHAVKDYLHMAEVLAEYPSVKATFNFVPSLIEQIEDYSGASGRRPAEDAWAAVSRKAHPDDDDKRFMLDSFFSISWDRFVRRYPPYWRLLQLRNQIDGSVGLLSNEYWRDLATWFNLAWIEPTLIQREPELRALVDKDGDFSAADLNTVLDWHRRICGRVLPAYRELEARGQIEVSTSPYYHPILPLLVDTRSAREATPHMTLPNTLFAHPDDAVEQLRLGWAAHERAFGRPPRGLWPSEGALSHAVAELLTAGGSPSGWQWAASDEGILSASLGVGIERNGDGDVLDPRTLYQPYRFGDTDLALIFRDRVLADRIGFAYRHFSGRDGAEELIARLRRTADQVADDPEPYLVPVILDGENCWEEYENNGNEFLHALYQGLSQDPALRTVTLAEYVAEHPPRRRIERLRAGSWIFGNLETWIGEDEQNRAWEYLAMARARLTAWQRENPEADPDALANARRSLYIAEGSDWFWWYYSRNKFGQEQMFDREFRSHLGNVYLAIGLPVPPWLRRPIAGEPPPRFRLPGTYVRPRLSAEPQAPIDWANAGFADARRSTGVMQQGGGLVGRLYFGYDAADLHLRLEATDTLAPYVVAFYLALPGVEPANTRPRLAPDGLAIRVSGGGLAWEIAIPSESGARAKLARAAGDGQWEPAQEVAEVARKSGVVEVSLPFSSIGVRLGDTIGVLVAIERDRRLVEVFPGVGDEPESLTIALTPHG